MNILTKKEKVNFVLEKVKEHGISAYELGKKTGLNISGLERILSGSVKNPHEKTLDTMIDYLKTLYKNNTYNTQIVHEEIKEYTFIENQKDLIDCLNEQVSLMKEISRLKIILEKNNIDY